MMNEKITTVIEYLTSSVANNEVTNVDKVTLAIDELEDFPMTFGVLESSGVSQILQSIRHSKQITVFISERIRSLIKCWRQLLNAEIVSVVPREIKYKFGKTPAVKNGYSNGYVKEHPPPKSETPVNGINHNKSKEEEASKIVTMESETLVLPKNIVAPEISIAEEKSKDLVSIIVSESNPCIDKSKDPLTIIESQPNIFKDKSKDPVTIIGSQPNIFKDKSKDPATIIESQPNPCIDKSNDPVTIIESQPNLCIDKSMDPVIVIESQPNICIDKSNDPVTIIERQSNTSVDKPDEKPKTTDPEVIVEKTVANEIKTLSNDTQLRARHTSTSSKVSENVSTRPDQQILSQIGKPKLKSTKELLADFSNLIENDIKNKIMMDKISQEDDEPVSYFPKDSKIKELVQMSLIQERHNQQRKQRQAASMSLRKRRAESVQESEPDEPEIPVTSKCAELLKQFNEQCINHPRVVLTHFVPWPNLKRPLQMHAPEIKVPLAKRKRLQSSEITVPVKPAEDPLSIDVINNLLESFEVRANQKQMISEAIQQRKEQTKVIDNTLSLVDMSLKLKLKIPKVPTIKIRRKKRRKKNKKLKVKPIKIKVKKPRKPWIRPVPPITNYLDDIPILRPLTDTDEIPLETDERERIVVDYCEENVTKLAYGVLEGYNCTKTRDNSQILSLTKMYSTVINQNYLHVFPWVDLDYPTKSTFPMQSEEVLQSIINIQSFYS